VAPGTFDYYFVHVIYWIFFGAALLAALKVVLAPHAIHAALYLVMTMVAIAGLFILVNAQLAAAFQVIVYAGAIMVLFLFVIMLLNVGHMGLPSPRLHRVRQWALLFVATFAWQVIALIYQTAPKLPAGESGPQSIGIAAVARTLLTDYIYAFEMTSVLLLVAVIGSVILAQRRLDRRADGGAADRRG
jgi:NADH-quinone oxidoreductase subunit J